MDVLTLHYGDPRYVDLLDRIRTDRWLVNRMRQDADSGPDELDVPGTTWVVAVVDGQPAAWCAATPTEGTLKCHSNYEHPRHRGRGLYAAAYRQRHRDVVQPAELPGLTYLFAQPIRLHEADGWRQTGVAGVSGQGHRWWELRRYA